MISRDGVAGASEEALRDSFLTALLLTQNAACAEAAVMSAIEDWDANGAPGAAFLNTAIGVSLEGYHEMPVFSERDLAQAASLLPGELHGVLHLASPLRQCYVLRTLMKWPPSECARALRLRTTQVKRYTRAAALEICSAEKRMAAATG